MFSKKTLIKVFILFFYFNPFILVSCEDPDCSTCSLDITSHVLCQSNEGHPCNSNCKYSYEHRKCIYCPNLNTYYTITDENTCKNECTGDKIFGDTNECTSQELPNNYYRLGDVYYLTPPTNTVRFSYVCQCKNSDGYFFYLEEKSHKSFYFILLF